MHRWVWAVVLAGCGGGGDDAPACADCAVTIVRHAEVTGACPGPRGLRLDVVLTDEVSPVGPEAFEVAPTSADFLLDTATLAPVGPGEGEPVALASRGVTFVGPAGPRLVVLVVDQSASLVGTDPETGLKNPEKASDPQGLRFPFFSGLLTDLPPDDEVALVSFKGLFGVVDPAYSTPTTNRGATRAGLATLDGSELGMTPLARGLIDALEKVIEVHPERAPVVVLFTDGVEAGDSSDLPDRPDISDLEAATQAYEAQGIPVHVLQLAPPAAAETPRARDERLADLACRTGGSWTYLPDAASLSEGTRRALVDRMAGAWRVDVDAALNGQEGGSLLDVRGRFVGTTGGGRPWIFW
ncbi:MAG: hypothetical protein R3F60_08545 [bacterium]